MNLKDRITAVDKNIKIVSAVLVLLVVGFVGSAIGDIGVSGASPDYGDTSYSLDAPVAQSGSGAYAESDASAREKTESQDRGEKIITTYRMTLKVPDVNSAMESIESEVQARGGFVESSSRSSEDANRGSLTVSVPANVSEAYENDLEARYDVESRNVDRRDVTDSYNELEAEIKSLETEYQRLNELINQTDEVDTLIQLQERLSEVRSQLNYRQQRLDRLQEDVTYSTFHITLEGPQSFESRFEMRETLSDAYTAVFKSFKYIILGAAYLVPFALIYAIYRAAIRVKDRGF